MASAYRDSDESESRPTPFPVVSNITTPLNIGLLMGMGSVKGTGLLRILVLRLPHSSDYNPFSQRRKTLTITFSNITRCVLGMLSEARPKLSL